MSLSISLNLKIPPAALTSLTPRIHRAICDAIDRENQNTIAHAIRHKLSAPGPATLATRTGRLRNSLQATPAAIAPDGSITSAITSSAPYAPAHEYGFTGRVTIRAHLRRPLASFKPLAPLVHVKTHTRLIRLPSRSFIRSSLAERAPAYHSAILKNLKA